MPKLFNSVTNKQGLFVFGGEASSDYGIVVAEAPTFERPVRKQNVFTIPGRSGVIIEQQDAWEDVSRVYKVWLTKEGKAPLNEAVNNFMAALNSQKGYVRLEDSFEPEVFRLAYYSGGNDVSNEMTQYGESSIKFTCRPERFYKNGEDELTITTGDKIYNPTKFMAKPLIHLEGTGTSTIIINGRAMSVTFANGYVNIDCDTMNAYRLPSENKNADITGVFPTLEPGTNTVTLGVTITACKIIPRFFTI